MSRDLSVFTEALAEMDEDQRAETRDTRHVGGSVTRGQTTREQPPDDVIRNIETYHAIPHLYKGVNKFASDVVAPGWRIEADNSKTVDELEEWGESAAILGGVTHKDVQGLARQAVICHQVTGNIATEHVKADPTDSNDTDITGMKNLAVESLYPVTEPGKSVLIQPEDTDRDDVTLTAREEAAAYIQWHTKSPLGRRNAIGDDRTEIPLSLNDVTKTANSPGPSDIWGTSPLSTVADRVDALKQKLLDNEEAIAGKAYGVWSVGFGREVLEPDGMPSEIVEFDKKSQDDFMDDIGDLEPGQVISHDGVIDFERFEGEVAEILDYLLYDIDYILTALDVPKYAVGHGEDITQHVTQRQAENYEEKIIEMQGIIEDHLTPMFRKRAEQVGLSTEGLRFKLEPQEDESPVRSLSTEEIGNIKTYVEALKEASPAGNVLDVINEDSLRELVLQLPDDAAPDDDEIEGIDEANPQVLQQFEQAINGSGADGDEDGPEPPDGDGEGEGEGEDIEETPLPPGAGGGG